MKKISAIIILGLLLLAGCSESENNAIIEQNDSSLQLRDVVFFEIENEWDNRTDDSKELSYEEAAQLSLDYFSTFLGEDLDGKYVGMVFNYNHHISESSWSANVFGSMPSSLINDDIDWDESSMFVLMDAFTGELMGLANYNAEPLHGFSSRDIWNMTPSERLEWFPEPDAEEIIAANDVARVFAEKHFQNSSITSVKLGMSGISEEDYLSMITDNLDFIVEDSAGNVIVISLQRETHKLINIHTPLTPSQLEMLD